MRITVTNAMDSHPAVRHPEVDSSEDQVQARKSCESITTPPSQAVFQDGISVPGGKTTEFSSSSAQEERLRALYRKAAGTGLILTPPFIEHDPKIQP